MATTTGIAPIQPFYTQNEALLLRLAQWMPLPVLPAESETDDFREALIAAGNGLPAPEYGEENGVERLAPATTAALLELAPSDEMALIGSDESEIFPTFPPAVTAALEEASPLRQIQAQSSYFSALKLAFLVANLGSGVSPYEQRSFDTYRRRGLYDIAI